MTHNIGWPLITTRQRSANQLRIGVFAASALLLASMFVLLSPQKSLAQELARDSASVIMYHRFGEDRYPSTNIRIPQFEEHLALLTNGNYTVLPLPEIIKPCKLAARCQTEPSR